MIVAAALAGCSSGGGSPTVQNGTWDDAATLGRITSVVRDASGTPAYYRFVAAMDGRLRVALDFAGGADLDIALFRADGARLATSRSNVEFTEVLYAEVSGGSEYFVEVSGSRASFRLAIEIHAPPPSVATSVDPLRRARSFHAIAALPDGGAWVAGGTTDPSSPTAAILNALDSTERFDPASGVFASGPSLGTPRFAPAATVLPTGRVLIAGGDLAATADLFDPVTGNLQDSIPLTGGIRVLATATLLPDGRVLIAGGTTIDFSPLPSARALDTTTVFDPKSRTFAPGPAMQFARTSHAAALAPDGRVLLIGGVGRSDTEWIDVAASTSLPGPALGTVRDDHTATALADGRILVAGGQDAAGVSLATAEILDPGAAAFRLLPGAMADRRADHIALRLRNGSVLLIGGEADPASGPDVILTSVDRFDPATEAFTPASPLMVPRDDHRVARLLDGRLLVTGGEDASAISIRDVEVYLPD